MDRLSHHKTANMPSSRDNRQARERPVSQSVTQETTSRPNSRYVSTSSIPTSDVRNATSERLPAYMNIPAESKLSKKYVPMERFCMGPWALWGWVGCM